MNSSDIRLVLISIGLPEKAKSLIDHLEINDNDFGINHLFVDPENKIYDDLQLNRGVKETFFSETTPLAFVDRFFKKKDGMKELLEVLGKWNKAFYIPPKLDQSLLQGGTFVFDGEQTLLAHYDASTGAHSDIDDVIAIARGGGAGTQ
eukprot:CAMPEP_0119554112 /NCGR_PEP_ID=MMETSP1352-20130426/6686_1 /TAXON_ID=265584 /ORGANISM="Stauroneis constricta, Strain CCMP1120" /LENGTH=147 /DNA_ID=CAMNT_0007600639 /DNA_START=394 /DNA_END=836 /DNA_ORIENTATION=-